MDDQMMVASSKRLALIILVLTLAGCGQDDFRNRENKPASVGTSIPEINVEAIDHASKSATNVHLQRPKSIADCLRLAQQSLTDEQFQDALQYATYAIELKPDLADGYYLRAKARCELEDAQQKLAIPDLEKATTINPLLDDAFFMLANIYSEAGQQGKALSLINQAIKIRPGGVQYYYFRSLVFDALGRKKEALTDLNTCVKLEPYRAFFIRGKFLQSKGDDEQALKDYSRAVELSLPHFDMGTVELLKLRAALLSKLGRHKEAMKDLSLVIDKDAAGDEEDVLRLRGNEFAASGDYEKAIRDYTRVITVSPQYARASYEARGNTYKKLGKLRLAEDDFRRAKVLTEQPAEKPVYDVR